MAERLLGHVKSGQIPEKAVLIAHLSDEVLALFTGAGSGDMSKAVYDIDGNGIVDEAQRIDGGSFTD